MPAPTSDSRSVRGSDRSAVCAIPTQDFRRVTRHGPATRPHHRPDDRAVDPARPLHGPRPRPRRPTERASSGGSTPARRRGSSTSTRCCCSTCCIFLVGFVVLATQPWHPAFLNPDDKGMLSPTTIFNTACSFLTNTNLQHYSGEVHLSYCSQLFVIMFKQFLTPAIGLAALLAVIRGLRGDKHMGNFYLDLWRGAGLRLRCRCRVIVGVLLIAGGMPMTLEGNAEVADARGRGDGDRRRRHRRSRRRSPAGRSPRSWPSSNSAPTAAASSARTRPIRSRTRPPGPTSSRASASS